MIIAAGAARPLACIGRSGLITKSREGKTMFKRSLVIVGVLAIMILPVAAQADWMDDFESYEPGSEIIGQGGWDGWLGDPLAGAEVSDSFAHGGSNSVGIASTSDLVHTYEGYTSGVWIYTAWMYMLPNYTGETYFIMLNTYVASQNWSVQIHFIDGECRGDTFEGYWALPWILEEWVEIRLEIDLDADIQTVYYGGDFFYTGSWSQGVSGGGQTVIEAVDLFGNGARTVYYDDMSLMPDAVATEDMSWSDIKSLYR
jgi:hypothetical protein